MEIKEISENNLRDLVSMFLGLWPDCNFEEELENCRRILHSDKETCFLVQKDRVFVAFIYLSLRFEYVEGTNSSPVAYVEGIYVKPAFRKQGVGQKLIKVGQSWGLEKGCKEMASDAELKNESSIAFHKKVGFKEENRILNFSKLISSELQIQVLAETDELPYDLLELADPSRLQIDSYLKSGTCYLAKLEAELIGVFVLQALDSDSIEIKNIAIKETEQGKGYGKILLKYSEQLSREQGYKNLLIGTGNSSLGQLALYQKMGFEIESIKKDFFIKNYAEPIFENGMQCKHMLVLKKELVRKF